MSEEDYVSMESYDRLMSEKDKLEAQLRAAEGMEKALEHIACYHDGPVVTGAFDDPASAQIARDALDAWREARGDK